MFTIRENRIKMDATRKLIDYNPYNHHCLPLDLHLRGDKLWFVNLKDHNIVWCRGPTSRLRGSPPAPPVKNEIRISYFDLNKECPVEVHVETIDASFRPPSLKILSNLQWVNDSLIIHLNETKFYQFDLVNHGWSSMESRYIKYY